MVHMKGDVMQIKIQIRGRVFAICIGHKTLWFEQMPFISVAEEWYENREVVYAKMIWRTRYIMDGAIY